MGAVGDDFYDGVLQDIAAPATANTLQLCRDWQRFEGGDALWNPWNTTQKAPGSWDYNSAGVQNFPNEQTGIEATVITLRNGYYPNVVQAFQGDLPENQWGLSDAIIAQINIWGTHGFAAYLQSIAGQPVPPPTPPVHRGHKDMKYAQNPVDSLWSRFWVDAAGHLRSEYFDTTSGWHASLDEAGAQLGSQVDAAGIAGHLNAGAVGADGGSFCWWFNDAAGAWTRN